MTFPPRYELVPTVDKDDEAEPFTRRKKPLGNKRFFLYLISFAALMVAGCSAVRLARSRGFWMTCYGPRRDQSNLARLPSHYTLPSGDKIPSVALGRRSIYATSITWGAHCGHIGVWQAKPGEVGNAVEVSWFTYFYRGILSTTDGAERRLPTHRRSLDL